MDLKKSTCSETKMCGSSVRNLTNASKEEQRRFVSSFDLVLSDMDGVIWNTYETYPGAPECIDNLKKMGKKVGFVSNNTTVAKDKLFQLLHKNKFSVNEEDVIIPTVAFIDYLKKIGFDKTLFVVGGQALKEDLAKSGFKLAIHSTDRIEETIQAIIETIADNEEIGAVIVDFDLNINRMILQKCLTYLKRSDCIFIAGAGDKMVPFSSNGPLIGNSHFLECLKDISGRVPYQLAKPSSDFNDFVVERFNITDPKRVLFIGDSINEDMKFAGTGGYQKLLVLTGSAQKQDVINWTRDECSKPDFYVESLAALNLILGLLQVK